MTTIAFKDGFLAADTQINAGNSRFGTTAKIFRIGKQLVGFSGLLVFQAPFMTWLAEGRQGPCPIAGLKDEEESEALAVNVDGIIEIFRTNGAWASRPLKGMFAIGSGADYALGAMAAGKSAEEAVHIAMIFDTQTGGAVTALHLEDAAATEVEELDEDDEEVEAQALAGFTPMWQPQPSDASPEAETWRQKRGL